MSIDDLFLGELVLKKALGCPTQEGHGPVAASPEEAIQLIRGLEPLSY